MKHQQISVDFLSMMFSACSYLALAGAVWIFLRLVQACFWLPRHLKKQNDIQQLLQDKVENYEKYILECEEKERTEHAVEGEGTVTDPAQISKWRERRECLEMLKRELCKVRDTGDDSYDWDYLLEEEETNEQSVNTSKIHGDEMSKAKCNKVDVGAGINKQVINSNDKKEK